MKCIIGRKREMGQVFLENGTVVPVTWVDVATNVVTAIKTPERDGYTAVALGTEGTKHMAKPQATQWKDFPPCTEVHEFRVDQVDVKLGDTLDVSVFSKGMSVDVTGTSKGRGFAGVVKRHHFRGGKATHGQKDQMRMPGSLASQRQGPVTPGQRMAGHMGNERVTVKNLEVIAVDPQTKSLAVKGAIPGARGGVLLIEALEGKTIWQR